MKKRSSSVTAFPERGPRATRETVRPVTSHEAAGIFTPELALRKDGDSLLFDRPKDPLQTDNFFNAPCHKEAQAPSSYRPKPRSDT